MEKKLSQEITEQTNQIQETLSGLRAALEEFRANTCKALNGITEAQNNTTAVVGAMSSRPNGTKNSRITGTIGTGSEDNKTGTNRLGKAA